ncbi:F-box only protein 43-like [Diprion similis]|uniref:F-box only protein 43-like n=1 Tax=Diprion similis TaxID=362088 RepID=UPI001EF787B0|nr:F-box only protein 43-like [Diprion similis]
MEKTDSQQSSDLGDTPHLSSLKKQHRSSMLSSSRMSTRSSYDNADSGYITLSSPPSVSFDTPAMTSATRTTAGNRLRSNPRRRYLQTRSSDPWPSDRASRFRCKLNTTELGLEGGSSSVQEAREIQIQNRRTAADGLSLTSELEDLLRRQHRGKNGKDDRLLTSVPTTPASTLQLLSPPPSPAVPSLSFMASEPAEDEADVEMSLVTVPQSTPHLNPTTTEAVGSPTTSRETLTFASSVENHKKMSRLMITDPSLAEIRPKRLDFSQRPKFTGLRKSRAIPCYVGKSSVDFMSVLGEESDHWRVVSKILAFLDAKDLCAVSMVSKSWRRICERDSRARMRRYHYVILRQNIKENLKLIQAKAKSESDVLASPKSRYARKGLLVEVQNLLQVPNSHHTPSSPPVSPSKVKFHSFLKAARTLEPSKHLVRCPGCSFACPVNGEKNTASCTRQGCSMEFCILCSSQHKGPCKTALLATPTKRNKRLIAGSRQSKRNLRRL